MNIVKSPLQADVIPVGIKPKPEWGQAFDGSVGFTVPLPQKHRMTFFFDKALSAGTPEVWAKSVDQHTLIGHSVTEFGTGWDVFAEPIGQDMYGITVHTAAGRTIAAGTGSFTQAGDFVFQVNTLYDNIGTGMGGNGNIMFDKADSKWSTTVGGKTGSDGKWEVNGSVTYAK